METALQEARERRDARAAAERRTAKSQAESRADRSVKRKDK